VATGIADTPAGLGVILMQVDKEGKIYGISFASRQLMDLEKNFSTFLLEATAAVWGMDFFNEYLHGKQFILYTDHKPLEKLSHLHNKTLNCLQTALLEHNFIIKYKKVSNMPANYLSRLPGTRNTVTNVSAFDPFQASLFALQMKDEELQMLQQYMTENEWPASMSKADQNYFQMLTNRALQEKNKVVGVRLLDFNYPRTALYLPEKYRKAATCEAHDSIFGGHNTTQKTYLQISTSYYWPKMLQDINKHKNICLSCQQRKNQHTKRHHCLLFQFWNFHIFESPDPLILIWPHDHS
jgi:hypothetical protein